MKEAQMRGLKRNPWLFGLGVLLAIPVVPGGQAGADITTDQSGSVLVFPKVVADGERDTLIKITNRSNMAAQAHCFYTNALGTCSGTPAQTCVQDSDCPATESCDVDWTVTNFDVFLTAQQPTMWRVSTGRFVDILSAPCNINNPDCGCEVNPNDPATGAPTGGLRCPGFDPGTGGQNSTAILGMGTAFYGELRCVQTDVDFQTPIAQNSLLGEAIIEDLDTAQVSQYNALAISANPGVGGAGLDTNNDLNLDNGEFNACPESLVFTHYGDGAVDTFSGAVVETELTLVPCTSLYEQAVETPVTVSFQIVNEFEQVLSADGVSFDCFFNARLSDIANVFERATIGTQFAKTRVTPTTSNMCLTGDNRGLPCVDNADCPAFLVTADGTELGCRAASGVLGIAEEFHDAVGQEATAAFNLHIEGSRTGGDIIVVPAAAP